jgi:hypothetical protein
VFQFEYWTLRPHLSVMAGIRERIPDHPGEPEGGRMRTTDFLCVYIRFRT